MPSCENSSQLPIQASVIYQEATELKDKLKIIFPDELIFTKKDRLDKIEKILSSQDSWGAIDKINSLNQEKKQLINDCEVFNNINTSIDEIKELTEIADKDNDNKTIKYFFNELDTIKKQINKLEFETIFNNKLDSHNAYLEIQSGSGGTESQDWASMLLRMYIKWSEAKNFKPKILSVLDGETAGIKSATILLSGKYAYGWSRTENGIHRLVRKSPFNANGKRHTSFASVVIMPEVDDDINIEINPQDLRIDTYRASGAGGQHVNKTDSAVRIIHIPTNTVVQCQSGRSQHMNKEQAIKQLKSKLYDLEKSKQDKEKKLLENNKTQISWGNQIRSYVLDQSRIKDLRTNVESTNTQAVLDGDLDNFIKASLIKFKNNYEKI